MRTIGRHRSKWLAAVVIGATLLAGCSSDDDPTSPPPGIEGFAAATTDNAEFPAIAVDAAGNLMAVTNAGGAAIVLANGASLFAWAGSDGLPERVHYQGTTALFENWTAETVDIGLVSESGEISIHRAVPLPSDVSRNLSRLAAAGLSTASTDRSLAQVLRDASVLLTVASCTLAVIDPTAISAITCATGVLQIAIELTAADDPALATSATAIGGFLDYVGCATGDLLACIGAAVSTLQVEVDIAEQVMLANDEPISLARGALGGGGGDVQITLTWDNTADVDLHVVDPYGEEIAFYSPYSSSGGWLDVDDVDGYGPENVFWPAGGAPSGTYTVHVHHYAGPAPSQFQVLIQQAGYSKIYSGTLYDDQYLHVATFTYGTPLPSTVEATYSVPGGPPRRVRKPR
jgi:hypothetical protein